MAKLIECKTCKKEVAANAKVCPHCGQKNPGLKTKDVLIGLAILTIAIGFFINSGDDSKDINKNTFNGKWPFTKDTATINCYKEKDIKMPVVIVDNKTYGLTGFANSIYGSYESVNAINQIWLKDKNNPGLNIDLSDVTKAATDICK